MSDYTKLVHFFGEMDLDLSHSQKKLSDEAFDIAENCGYFTQNSGKYLVLNGIEGEKFILSFNAKGKVDNIIDKTRGLNKYYGVVDGDISSLPKYDGYGAGFY